MSDKEVDEKKEEVKEDSATKDEEAEKKPEAEKVDPKKQARKPMSAGRGRGRGRGGRGGARGAMAAFKNMDAKNAPTGSVKRNIGGGKQDPKSPAAIKEAMIHWCQMVTKGYPHVNITNFSSSFNNGMAFCALTHRFLPDAFDFMKLDPANRKENFQLAFETAEKQGDVTAILEVEDMVRMKNPDWKCVFTYMQLFYRRFHNEDLSTPPKFTFDEPAATAASTEEAET